MADPYRWLEDSDSADTRAWIEAENRVTFDYLKNIPERKVIFDRLRSIWDYERFGTPSREGAWYVFAKNTGLQKQSVVYKANALDATPDVLIDPNGLSADGTVALSGTAFTEDGKYMAYSLAASGSDWIEWRVRDVATSQDLPDIVKWSKFSGAAWTKDGSGFYYSRYDEPKGGDALKSLNKNQKLYFHKLGTTQDKDALIYERPDQPDWGLGGEVSDDGRYLVITPERGDGQSQSRVRERPEEPNGASTAVPERLRRQLHRDRQ